MQPGLADTALGHGAVWVTNPQEGTLTKIDPASADVQQVLDGLGGPSGLTIDDDYIWVADTFGKRIVAIVPLRASAPEIELALAPSAIAHAGGSIWTTHPLDNVVTHIDLATDQRTLIPVGRSPTHIAAEDTAAWIVNDLDHTVTRIDTSTATVSETIEFNEAGSATVISPAGIDIGDNHVWITLQAIYPDREGNS